MYPEGRWDPVGVMYPVGFMYHMGVMYPVGVIYPVGAMYYPVGIMDELFHNIVKYLFSIKFQSIGCKCYISDLCIDSQKGRP